MSIEIVKTSHQTIGRKVLLYPLLRTLNVAETINRTVFSEAEISPGTIADIILLSRFATERVPMYQLSTFCEPKGLDPFYSIDPEKLNDDRVGRGLDALHPSLRDLKTALIVGAIKTFDLTVTPIHTDRTHLLFEGSDEGTDPEPLQVTWGHTQKGPDPRCLLSLSPGPPLPMGGCPWGTMPFLETLRITAVICPLLTPFNRSGASPRPFVSETVKW